MTSYVCHLESKVAAKLLLDADVILQDSRGRNVVWVVIEILTVLAFRIWGLRRVRQLRTRTSEGRYRSDAEAVICSISIRDDRSTFAVPVLVKAVVVRVDTESTPNHSIWLWLIGKSYSGQHYTIIILL